MAEHTIGKLKVKLALDSSEFHKNINKIKGKIDEVKNKCNQSLNNISVSVKTKIDGLTDKFDEMKKSSNYLTSAFGEIGSGLIDIVTPGRVVAGVIAAIGVAIAMAVKTGADMNRFFERMQVTTGATGKSLSNLQTSLRKVIELSSSTADVLGSAFGNINRYLGLTGQELENLTILMAKYADITGEDAEATSDIMGKLFNNWSVNVENYDKTMNVLFGITQKTGISLSELAQQLLDNGSTFRKVGFSIEEAAIQLAAFNKYGYYATTATDILYSALDKLKEDGLEPTKADYEDLIKLLTETDDIDLISEVFGTSYYAYEAIDAIKTTSDEVKFLTENIKNYDNSLNESIQLQEGGATEAWTKLSNKLANTAGIMFEQLEPAIVYIINIISDLIDIVSPCITIFLKLISVVLLPIMIAIEVLKRILVALYDNVLKPIYDWVVNFIDACEPLKTILNYFAEIGKTVGGAWDWLTGDKVMSDVNSALDTAQDAIGNYCDSLDSALEKVNQLSKTNVNNPYVNTGDYQAVSRIFNQDRISNTAYYNNITVQSNGYPSEEIARIHAYNKAMDAIKVRY